MGVNCCDICKAFDYCMKQPDGVNIDDFEKYFYDRAACRFKFPWEYKAHLTLIGEVEE